MDFDLTEEQLLIQKTARDFARNELKPGAEERDREGRFPEAELKQLAELGLMGVNVPEAYGGTEAGVVSYSLAMIELSKACASTSVAVAVTNMVAELICQFGTEEQKRTHVGGITSGEYVTGAFALSEPQCGSDVAAMRTRAVKDGDSWVLNGSKQWITSADHAGIMVVWAKTNPDTGSRGISAFLVPGGTPGVLMGRHEDKMGLRGSTTMAFSLEDCRLPADALLGDEGMGFKLSMIALDGGRVGVASQALGIGLAALEEGGRYAMERTAFGEPLTSRQAIQWMLADTAIELEAARLLTMQAAWMKENGRPVTMEASMAKVFASEAAWKACDRMLQIHGGYGYVKEYPIERYMRDCRVTRIYEGTSEVQRLVIARELMRRFERYAS